MCEEYCLCGLVIIEARGRRGRGRCRILVCYRNIVCVGWELRRAGDDRDEGSG